MTPLDYQKKVEELKKLKLENLSTLLGIIVKVGAAGGTVAVFGYCFFFIKFFPTGLQVGDTLFFLFVLLGIGITGTLVSGLGFISGLPWLWRNRLPGGPTTPTKQEIAAKIGLIVGSALFLYSCRYYLATAVQEGSAAADAGSNCWRTAHGGLAFIAALVYLYYAYRLMKNKVTSVGVTALWLLVMSVVAILLSGVDDSVALSFGGGIVAGGLYMTLAVDSLDWKKHGKKSLMPPAIFTLCAVLLPFVFGAGEKMFGFVFSSVGIRTEHTTLIVDRKNLHTLQAAADAKGVKLYTCEMAEDTHAISRADILWHGIGERSYVAIKGQTRTKDARGGERHHEVRVELDSKGVKRTEAGREVSCAELRRGIYFESGKYRVERNQWDSASPLAKQFLDDTKSNDASAVTRSLLITGYADPMSEVKTGNPVLARQRACHVYARMKPLLDEPLASNVFIDSRIGTGDPVCSNKEKAGDLRACYEKDRRVTLQRIDTKEKLDRVGAVAVKDACVELDAMVREIASTSPSASDK